MPEQNMPIRNELNILHVTYIINVANKHKYTVALYDLDLSLGQRHPPTQALSGE